jgi:hypothetical protein
MFDRFMHGPAGVLVAFVCTVGAVVTEENQVQLQGAHSGQPFGEDHLPKIVILVVFDGQLPETMTFDANTPDRSAGRRGGCWLKAKICRTLEDERVV